MKSNCCKVKCHFHIGNYMEDDSTRKRKIDRMICLEWKNKYLLKGTRFKLWHNKSELWDFLFYVSCFFFFDDEIVICHNSHLVSQNYDLSHNYDLISHNRDWVFLSFIIIIYFHFIFSCLSQKGFHEIPQWEHMKTNQKVQSPKSTCFNSCVFGFWCCRGAGAGAVCRVKLRTTRG